MNDNDDTIILPPRPAIAPSKSDADNAMSKYFRDIASHRVLTKEQETALAEDIESLEVEVWKRLLSFAPTAPYIATRIEAELKDPPKKALRSVVRAAGKTKASLDRASAKAAVLVRARDLDKDHLKSLLGDLDRATSDRFKIDIACSPKSKAYRAHVDHVRLAHSAASRARSAFVRANLRLVISIARRYSKGPMGLSDLIQEGNLGLIKAVDRFDHRRGFRFSTYASWWIRHSVGRALADRGREVRVPVHMVDATYRIKKARRELMAKLGREPTESEIATDIEMPVAKLRQMSTLLLGHPLSMNQPVSNDDDRPLIEVFEGPPDDTETPVESLDRQLISRALRQEMLVLSPIETDVLRRRFGLGDHREHTLQEIADSYSRSRERIRQIQAAALRKLRLALSRRDIRAA